MLLLVSAVDTGTRVTFLPFRGFLTHIYHETCRSINSQRRNNLNLLRSSENKTREHIE